jgi:hypothetical protein
MRFGFLAAIALLGLAVCASACEQDDAPPGPSAGTEPNASAAANLVRDRAAIGSQVIGRSVEGRLITSVTLGSGARTIVVIGGLHTGIEAETVSLVERLVEHYSEDGALDGVRLVFISDSNPDGLTSEVRTNANSVDLNRNWPTDDWRSDAIHGESEVFGGDAPLSEPETKALYDYLLELRPDMALSIHGFAGVVQHNGTGVAGLFANAFGEAAEFEVLSEWPHYEVTGELIEALAEEGIAAADVELFEADPESLDRVLRGLDAALEALAESPDRS